MKQIPLSRGVFTIVDDEDYDWLSKFTWHCTNGPKKGQYVRRFEVDETGVRKGILMHRIIMGLSDPSLVVDHIDGDTLNNQRSNLRITTVQKNVWNSRPKTGTYSGYRGVCWDKNNLLFTVSIKVDGKRVHLGSSECAKTCARTYNENARKYFGEFSKMNIVEDGPLCKPPISKSDRVSGYRGVYPVSNGETWNVKFILNKKRFNIGCFKDPITAALAYDAAIFQHLGQKAQLNFPENYITS